MGPIDKEKIKKEIQEILDVAAEADTVDQPGRANGDRPIVVNIILGDNNMVFLDKCRENPATS